jgi:hypothetical protein
MKAFIGACVAMVVIAVGAWYALDRVGFTAAETQALPETVRLD